MSPTDEQLRIMVAEAMGWKGPFVEREWLRGRGMEGEDVYGKCVGTDIDGDRDKLPNYPADLNACAEFEKTLTTDQCFLYRDHLQKLVNPGLDAATQSKYFTFGATARQRCISFLKVKGVLK